MKFLNIFFIISFGFIVSDFSEAKTTGKLDMSNQSVQLLRHLNDLGKEVRAKDAYISKPDISADTSKVKELKRLHDEELLEFFPNTYIKREELQTVIDGTIPSFEIE